VAQNSLQDAVTAAGGTPTQNTRVGLWRQYVSAIGGTPTKWDVIGLLKEAVTARGGTPTQNTYVGLLRELITTFGASPLYYDGWYLLEQLAAVSATGAPDITAPTLSSPTAVSGGPATATISVSTTEASGRIYWVLTTSATPPTKAQVKAGQNNGGTAAAASGSILVTAAGVNGANPSGLTAVTTYYTYFMHEDGAGNQSTVAAAASFATGTAPDVTAPVLTSPTAASTGSSTATIGVTTDEGNGTLYYVSVLNGSGVPSKAQIKAGQTSTATAAPYAGSQPVTSTGAKTANATGFLAATTYTTYFMHEDTSGNQSGIATAANFTTGSMPGTNAAFAADNVVGSPPKVDLNFVGVSAGYILQIDRSLVGSGSYGTQPAGFPVFHMVTDPEVAVAAISQTALIADGYYDPGAGSWWQRYTWTRDDGSSGASSELSGTITASVAVWSSTTGVNKTQYLTVNSPFLAPFMNNDLGAPMGLRADRAASNSKYHFEHTIQGFSTGDAQSKIHLGICNSSTAFGPGVLTPGIGQSSIPGCRVVIARTATQGDFYANGSNNTVSFPGGTVPVVGDMIIIEGDKAANQVKYYYKRVAGSPTLMRTETMTGVYIPDDHYAYGAGQYGDPAPTSTNADQWSTNFGASAFVMTPTSGWSYYA
jgi:hypothetical protein